MLEINKIYQGDCLDVMKGIEDNSVDLVLTDPPYGYSFMGKDWDRVVMGVEYWRECYRVLKDGAFAFVMSAPRQDVLSRMIVNLQDAGFETGFTSLYWCYASGFPKAYNIAKGVEGKIKLGTANWSEWDRLDGEKGIRQMGYYKINAEDGNRPNNYNGTERTTKVNLTSPEAKALDGSYAGFQPKPALEVVLVVMKPLSEKTYVDQALKNGKGISWLDDGRIPFIKNEPDNRVGTDAKWGGTREKSAHTVSMPAIDNMLMYKPQGRFPANLLVSDDVLNDGNITKSIAGIRHNHSGMGIHDSIKGTFGKGDAEAIYNDSGSFSRYFDLDAWWDKLNELPESVQRTFPFIITPKASKSEKNKGCQGTGITDRENIISKNHHPTVKPIKLFSYLITLGSREGDLILDPFLGSGTTAVTCINLNRHYIGIELSDEYCEIARNRVADAIYKRDSQPNLF